MSGGLAQNLMNLSDNLVKVGQILIEANEKLIKLEHLYNIERARLLQSDRVREAGNQSMREAMMETILESDDSYSGLVRDYLMAKFEQKKAWINFEVCKELNNNLRVIMNNTTFGKDNV